MSKAQELEKEWQEAFQKTQRGTGCLAGIVGLVVGILIFIQFKHPLLLLGLIGFPLMAMMLYDHFQDQSPDYQNADRDPNKALPFRAEVSRFFIFDAINLHHILKQDFFREATVYHFWFSRSYPDLVFEDDARKFIAIESSQGINLNDFDLFCRHLE